MVSRKNLYFLYKNTSNFNQHYKVRINDPTLSSLNMIELFIEFDSELSLIISGHPDKHSNKFKEKIFEIRKSFEPEPWVGRDTLIEIMEEDSRIRIINNT